MVDAKIAPFIRNQMDKRENVLHQSAHQDNTSLKTAAARAAVTIKEANQPKKDSQRTFADQIFATLDRRSCLMVPVTIALTSQEDKVLVERNAVQMTVWSIKS